MNYPYVDMHCDTLARSYKYNAQSVYDGEGMQSIRKMCEAGQMAQFYAIFFPPEYKQPSMMEGFPAITDDQGYYDRLRSDLLKLAREHSDEFAMAHNYEEITENFRKGLSSAILTIEDGRLVGGSMEKLNEFYDQGVRAIALTWNYENCFGAPNSDDPKIMQKGLTDFGKEAIVEMNRIGMLVDVSHLSDGGFYDVADLCTKPFIASHSNCRALANHPRNLTDDMIRILGEKGGVTGLNFYSEFLNGDPDHKISRIADMVSHICHLIKVGGEDVVGIGTDFDGIHCELEIGCPSEVDLLFEALKKEGLTERQLDKIASENVMRVIRESMR